MYIILVFVKNMRDKVVLFILSGGFKIQYEVIVGNCVEILKLYSFNVNFFVNEMMSKIIFIRYQDFK